MATALKRKTSPPRYRARVFGPAFKGALRKDESSGTGAPRASSDEGLALNAALISPPFDPLGLTMLPEESSELGKSIEAMKVNIESFGHSFHSAVNVDDPKISEQVRTEVQAEHARLTNFFNNCALEGTFTELREKRRQDIETIGWGAWEVITGPLSGEIQFLNYIQGHRIRLAKQGNEIVTIRRPFVFQHPDGRREIRTVPVRRRFRRFAVLPPIEVGGPPTWFKEFGDPRVLDQETGRYETDEDPVALERRANELIYQCVHSPRTPYGIPRYIGVCLTIRGDRAAEEINYTTLRNNNIPSMILLLSNGQLTAGTVKRVKEFMNRHVRGSDNYSRLLVIEAEKGQTEGADSGTTKLDLERLVSEQMRDQLFQSYGKNNRVKIREAFRIAPLFVGGVEDFTRATAAEAKRTTDEQVFAPERVKFDRWMNQYFLPRLGIVYHEFVSLGPNVTDNQVLSDTMMTAERTGGMTPALARRIVGDIMGQALPEVTGIDPNVPFSIQLAERVKNQADMTVGAQVTSLKRVDEETGNYLDGLFKVRESLEAMIDARKAERGERERGDAAEHAVVRTVAGAEAEASGGPMAEHGDTE